MFERATIPTILFLAIAVAAPARAQPADTVLLNVRIVPLDTPSSIAEPIPGRAVSPGLIDSHIHAIRAGVRYANEVSWIGATTIAEALGRIRAAAVYARPGTWLIVAGGWTPQQFAEGRRPTQDEITAAAPEH